MHYLIRYGEIGLKGKNRPFFERKLIDNIKKQVSDKTAKITKTRGRVIVETDKDISEELRYVSGIVSFSQAVKISISDINDKVIDLIKDKEFESFRITVNRVNKDIDVNSNKLAADTGALVVEKMEKKVDLENFDINISIELIDDAYIFFEKDEGLGGLPVSTEGKVIVFIETEKGIEAAKKVMKRGCDVIPVSLDEIDISEINKYSPNRKELIMIKNIGEINGIAKERDARAVVVEDSLEELKDYDLTIPVLRPLVFG